MDGFSRRGLLRVVWIGGLAVVTQKFTRVVALASKDSKKNVPVWQDYPHIKLSNGKLDTAIILPDEKNGFYRTTRFDWSGMMCDIRFKGHSFVQPWRLPHNPEVTEHAIGTAEEFREPLGYEEAKVGEGFIKIGVGLLEKPKEKEYIYGEKYKIIKAGQWKVEKGPDRVSFEQSLNADTGYGYYYKKEISLEKDSPGFAISHILQNIGTKSFSIDHYCHNFFIIDERPIGPGYALSFPFAVRAKGDLGGVAETKGNDVVFIKDFKCGQSICSYLEGFGPDVGSNKVTVKNTINKAAIEITGDKPLQWINLYSVDTTVCVEPGIKVALQPQEKLNWVNRYRFLEL